MGISAERGRSTISRALALLEAFDRDRTRMNLTTLADASSLPIATAHRILQELSRLGVVERNVDGTFQIGVRLWEVGSLAARQLDLRQTARPTMEALHETTGQTIQLVVLDGTDALCVEKISGSGSVANLTEIAGRLPLHATSVGRVILAYSEPDLLARLAATGFERCTPRTVVMPGVLRANLDKVGKEKIAYCYEEYSIGASSIAAPIFGSGGQFTAALGILAKSSVDISRFAVALKTSSSSISRQLAAAETLSERESRAAWRGTRAPAGPGSQHVS